MAKHEQTDTLPSIQGKRRLYFLIGSKTEKIAHFQVIGDKKGGVTSDILKNEHRMADLEDIEAIVGVPIKFVHVIRNPFDNIATALLRAMNKRKIAPGEKVSLAKRFTTPQVK